MINFKYSLSPLTALLWTFGFSVISPTIDTSHHSFEKLQFFEAIFNMFGKAVFEVTEVEMMVYGHFPAASFYLSDRPF